MNAVVAHDYIPTPAATPVAPVPSAAASSWLARLALGFTARTGKTVLSHREHRGPLVVQRPFYPEGGVCHVYLLHPPGGIVGGDQLSLAVNVGPGAHTLITTPASSKFYRTASAAAQLSQQLQVDAGATLEWLPQDTILFAGCDAQTLTLVNLAPGARFIGWEILCLGRPGSNEPFSQGQCRQRFELWRDGQPLLIDRGRFAGSDPLLQGRWGLQGKTVTATLLATPCSKDMLLAVRAAIADDGFSATLLDDVLVCRYLGDQGAQARELFTAAWAVIRPLLLGHAACPPRVWAT